MTYDGVMLTFVPIFLMLYKKIKWQDNRKGLPYNGHFASLLYVLSFNTLYSKKRKCFSLSYLFKLRILKPEQNGKRSKSGHFGLYLKLLVSSSPPHPKRKKMRAWVYLFGSPRVSTSSTGFTHHFEFIFNSVFNNKVLCS